MFKINTEKLKELREHKGFTQQHLASLVHMDQSNYSKMEKGKFVPHIDKITLICKELHIPIQEILINEDSNIIIIDNSPQAIGILNNFGSIDKIYNDPVELIRTMQESLQNITIYLQNLLKMVDKNK